MVEWRASRSASRVAVSGGFGGPGRIVRSINNSPSLSRRDRRLGLRSNRAVYANHGPVSRTVIDGRRPVTCSKIAANLLRSLADDGESVGVVINAVSRATRSRQIWSSFVSDRSRSTVISCIPSSPIRGLSPALCLSRVPAPCGVRSLPIIRSYGCPAAALSCRPALGLVRTAVIC